jgi:hypothetical protein
MTSLPTAPLPGARASAWESFAHGCSVNEMAYLPKLVISPDLNNIDLVICLVTAFSRKHRSCSARVRLKELPRSTKLRHELRFLREMRTLISPD